MGKLLLLIAAALGGVAIWRRKTLQSDAAKLTELAKTNATKAGEAAKTGVAKVKKESTDAEPAATETPDEAVADAVDDAVEAADA